MRNPSTYKDASRCGRKRSENEIAAQRAKGIRSTGLRL